MITCMFAVIFGTVIMCIGGVSVYFHQKDPIGFILAYAGIILMYLGFIGTDILKAIESL